jgi:transketolase
MIKVDCPICGPDTDHKIIYQENLPQGSSDFSARKTPDNYHYQMVRCDSCGLLYASDIYSPEKIDQLYQESDFHYNVEIENLKDTYGNYLKEIDSLVPAKGRLLEIGCGNGFFLERAKRDGWQEVVGVEPSIKAIDQASSEIKSKIVHGNFNPDDFQKNSFDVVFFAMVIEHINDVNKFLQSIYKVLKPGGVVLGITHDEGSRLSKLLKEKCPIINDEHIYVFNRETLKKIFSKNSFIIETVSKVANKYSLRYWLKMLPLSKGLKNKLPQFLTKISLKLKAGNIFIVAKKLGKETVLNSDDQDIKVKELSTISKELFKMTIDLSYKNKAHHIGSALSCLDLMTALYFHAMQIDPQNHNDPNRDWFVMSKGHAAQAQYVALAKRGFFDVDILEKEFLVDGGKLGAHPDQSCVPGVEVSSGSLGHGLSLGAGVALAAKRDGNSRRAYVLLGDGECNEGMIWEAAMFASHHKLDNLVAIIDYNRLQAFGTTDETINLDPIGDKFKAFGWAVKEINGHNMKEIVEALDGLPYVPGKPSMIVANTIKGRGIKFMENKLESHYLSLDEEQYNEIVNNLES